MKTGEGNFLWAIGGKYEYGKTLDDVTVYNVEEDRWYSSLDGELNPMPHAVQGAGWTLHDNKIYCFGGKTRFQSGCCPYVQMYDIQENEWTLLPDLPHARSKLGKFYPVIDDRYVYLFGGDNIEGKYSRVPWNWRFDLESREWDLDTQAAPYPQSFPVATTHDGWIYYTAGNTGQGPYNSIRGALNQRYHPESATWEMMEHCPIPITDGGGDKWNGELHIVGGWNPNPIYYNRFRSYFEGNVKKLHLVYNYETDSWRREKDLPHRWHHGTVRAAGNYLWRYLGMIDEDVGLRTNLLKYSGVLNSRQLQHTNKIFRYDGTDWEEMSPAPVRKMNFSAVVSALGPVQD